MSLHGCVGSRADGQFNRPFGVACDSHGDVYVADTMNKRVQIFTSSGQFIDIISNNISWLPTAITIDSMNTVYVSGGYTVSMFNSKRQFINCLSTYRPSALLSIDPRYTTIFAGLAVDYTGNLLEVLHDRETIAIY